MALHLANTYGMLGMELARRVRAEPTLGARLVEGRPEILVQVDWAVEQEMAARLVDVMVRRTQLFYRDHDQGLGAVKVIAARMQELLGWDDARTTQEVDIYNAEVGLSRAWQTELPA